MKIAPKAAQNCFQIDFGYLAASLDCPAYQIAVPACYTAGPACHTAGPACQTAGLAYHQIETVDSAGPAYSACPASCLACPVSYQIGLACPACLCPGIACSKRKTAPLSCQTVQAMENLVPAFLKAACRGFAESCRTVPACCQKLRNRHIGFRHCSDRVG